MRNASQQYFYHPDHLGSSSFISDASGEACQFLAYLPYGEQWVDQRSSGSYDAPYKFSGKELDAETGYNYFGARYYDSGLSVWLSVDPLAEEYSNMSPYAYCGDNPIMLIDVDGQKIDWIGSRGVLRIRKALLSTEEGAKVWYELKESPILITLHMTNSLLVEQTNQGSVLIEGVADIDMVKETISKRKGRVSYAIPTARVFISIGSYSLQKAAREKFGVEHLSSVDQEQLSEFYQASISSGNYSIKSISGKSIKRIKSSEVFLRLSPYNHSDCDIIKEPTSRNESNEQYLSRVSVHESTHVLTSFRNYLNSGRAYNRNYDCLQEVAAYARENKAILETKK
jgi:RHS repeat-associated protein